MRPARHHTSKPAAAAQLAPWMPSNGASCPSSCIEEILCPAQFTSGCASWRATASAIERVGIRSKCSQTKKQCVVKNRLPCLHPAMRERRMLCCPVVQSVCLLPLVTCLRHKQPSAAAAAVVSCQESDHGQQPAISSAFGRCCHVLPHQLSTPAAPPPTPRCPVMLLQLNSRSSGCSRSGSKERPC